jgi:hypothetical protein
MRARDYLCLYRSKIETMLELSDVGMRELIQAMFDYLEEREQNFTDGEARILWRYWTKEFNAQEIKAQGFSKKQSERGKLGGQKSVETRRKRNEENEANASNFKRTLQNEASASNLSQRFNDEANASNVKPNEANASNLSQTDTDTDTEAVSDILYIAPTLERIFSLAKNPDVSISEEEARNFYDHYTAQDWKRSNGQYLPNKDSALVSAMRLWRRNIGKFDSASVKSAPRDKRKEIYDNINSNKMLFGKLFRHFEGHEFGDYNADPEAFADWENADEIINAIMSPEFSETKNIYYKYTKEN